MTGLELVSRVRRLLRDLGANTLLPTVDTMNSSAGQFWNDYEILTALNVAQDFFINKAIKENNKDLLSMLIVRGTYVVCPPSPTIPFLPLPNNYLLHIDCRVGQLGSLHLARIYLGGDSLAFLHVKHDAMFIMGNQYAISSMGSFNVGGILNYYQRPNKIVIGTFTDSFLPQIYYQDIVRYASSLLGTKEIHTQRDFKNYKSVTEGMKIKPKTPAVASSLER